ncbi:LemA family protein [Plantactinospora sp. S1510]|uniref:LemA family protein n=1 Tax=Plantactinospora alkalitolerans TaxID=2789879 RepID=A0ABS0H9D8_9ACTN|nr:LemA family protein [Plantactinospora alkalitolerans]MBF9135093.1 LemA family protein [Plantactinospora alkalitolerans]
MTTWIVGAVVVVLVLVAVTLVGAYNRLVRLDQKAQEAWSGITVQLERRYDLIPNLVNTVKGYATHEREVLERVTAARANALDARDQGVEHAAKAEHQFQTALKSLFAVSESYPQLRANESFRKLHDELVDTEDRISASRRFYNGVVRDFNTRRTTFPTNVFANAWRFGQNREFFDVAESRATQISEPRAVEF